MSRRIEALHFEEEEHFSDIAEYPQEKKEEELLAAAKRLSLRPRPSSASALRGARSGPSMAVASLAEGRNEEPARVVPRRRPQSATAKGRGGRGGRGGIGSSTLQEQSLGRRESSPFLVTARALARERSSMRAGRRKGGAGVSGSSYEQKREREAGWNCGFVRHQALGPLDAGFAGGSGLHASRIMRRSQSAAGGLDSAQAALGANVGAKLSHGANRVGKRRKKPKRAKAPSAFAQACSEIYRLWEELHIPTRDREFFREAYCGGNKMKKTATTTTKKNKTKKKKKKKRPSVAASHRVQEQLHLLVQHRDLTLQVLRTIDAREGRLAHLRRASVQQVCSAGDGDGDGDGNGDGEGGQMGQAVVALRNSSVAVVEAVMAWRGSLWRPHPFVWQGSNYLVKMQADCRFFGTTVDPRCRDVVFFADSSLARGAATVPDLKALRTAVKHEAKLQCELRGENKRLTSAGYYIPMLRWSPEDPAYVPDHLQWRADVKDEVELGPEGEDQEEEEGDEEGEEDEEEDELAGDEDEEEAQAGDARNGEEVLAASKQHLDLLKCLQEQIRDAQ